MQMREDTIMEVEVISSPPMEELEVFEVEGEHQEQERSVTPVTLGGSRFRRKVAPPSSPLENDSLVSNAGFGDPESSQSNEFVMPPSLGKYGTSNTEMRTGGRNSLTARTSSGKVISISKKPAWKKVIKQQEQTAAARTFKQNYYGVDIHGLLNNIEKPTSQPTPTYLPPLLTLNISDNSVHAPSGKVATELWTDKYRAKKFMDLLGDERIHRDIMRWIKHWDYCVFGRDIPKSSSYHSSYNNHNNHNNSNTGNQSGKFSSTNAKPATFGGVQAPDPYQRPQQKILMLHGPPGLGKTTLAHVAAKMAGYEVLEINASDDRSGSAARDKIVEAVETAGIDRRGRRGKERCVILDECDGGDAVSTRFFALFSARTDVLLEFRQSSIGFDSCG
jgi:ATPase family associated with various cellular activities (AAA)